MSAHTERCHKARAEDGPTLFQNGRVVFQVYHVGWLISGSLAIVATIVSLWLVNKHLQWYTNKREQRYIVRILFMVPIYALVSFASFLFWNHSTPLILIRDGYESTVLTAFFYLLLGYLSHDPEEQRAIFLKAGLSRQVDQTARKNGEEVKKWVFPLGFIKSKPKDGLYFLQMMKWGVLQYCVIRPTTALAAVILDYMGLYCEESWGLGWGHIYITVIVSISVTVAMYCLIQLYVPVAESLSRHRPLLKLFAIKAVVFLTFWQATFLSVLTMLGVVKDTKYMTAAQVNIGIGAVLETFEMMIFAFLHIRAFTYKPYRPSHPPDSIEPEPEDTPRLRSLGHAMDFRETFREIWVGWIYIWDKIRGREPTPDVGARRVAHYHEAFGRPRAHQNNSRTPEEKHPSATLPAVEVAVAEEVDTDIEGERQWLGVGDDYGYGLGYIKREKSDSLGVQIEKELERRGYSSHTSGRDHVAPSPDSSSGAKPRRQPSWWRRIYDRFSEHTSGHDDEQGMSLLARKSKRRLSRHSRAAAEDVDRDFLTQPDFHDPLPVSVIQQHRSRQNSRRPTVHDDVLAPLPIFKDSRIPRQLAPLRTEVSTVSDSSSGDNVSIDTRAPATNSPTTTSHADSLLGRVFAHADQSTVHGTDAGLSIDSHQNGSIDDEGCARLSKATHQLLGQYYEFGVPTSDVAHQSLYGYHAVPGPSRVEISYPADDWSPEPTRSVHRRESAQYHTSISPSQEPVSLTSQPTEGLPKRREFGSAPDSYLRSADYN